MKTGCAALLLSLLIVQGPAVTPVAAQTAPRLSGRILDYRGTPVILADLDFFVPGTRTKIDPTPSGAPAQTDKTTLTGDYTMLVLPDRYDIRFQPPSSRTDLVTILLESVIVSADTVLDITLPRGYPIFGTVTDPAGRAVSEADIDAVDAITGRRIPTPSDNTGASGAYRVIVPPGRYNVSVDPPARLRLAAALRTGVEVAAATRLDIRLEAGYRVTGRITDDTGVPVENADLDVDVSGTSERVPTPGDTSGPDGRFTMTAPAGSFDITVHPPAGATLASTTRFSVTVGADLDLGDLVLPPGVRVEAQVLGPGGLPFPAVKALLYSAATGLRQAALDATSDAAGRMVFRVPAGAYDVRLVPPAGVALDTLDTGRHEFRFDTLVTWDFNAPALHTLTVRLAAPAGATGVVRVWRAPRSGSPIAAVETTGGSAAAIRLPGGIYDVLVLSGSGWTPDSTLLEGVAIEADVALDVALEAATPVELRVGLPYPNPFREATRIPIEADAGEDVLISIVNVSGRVVRTAIATAAPDKPWTWDGHDDAGRIAAAGLYFIRAAAAGRTGVVRVIRSR